LEIHSSRDCQLEMWGLQNHHKAFEKVFNRPLVESCALPGQPCANGKMR
jgi:hypothetical protein